MRKAVLILVSALLLGGCITEKKRRKICNTCPVISASETSVTIKTETVPVNVPGAPGPTLYLENPCSKLCDENGNLRPNVNFTLGTGNQTVAVRNGPGGSLAIGAATGDKTVAATVTSTNVASHKDTAHIQYIPCENERTSFDGFCRWWTYGTGLILLIIGGRYYIKRRFRPP